MKTVRFCGAFVSMKTVRFCSKFVNDKTMKLRNKFAVLFSLSVKTVRLVLLLSPVAKAVEFCSVFFGVKTVRFCGTFVTVLENSESLPCLCNWVRRQ